MRKKLSILLILILSVTKAWGAGNIYFCGGSAEKKIALTFDDGPNDTSLSKILNLLKEEEIKASFFFIGRNIKAKKEQVKKTFDDGHLVLNHSYSHLNFQKASKEEIVKEIEKTNLYISDIIGLTPTLYRPPYGINTANVKLAVKQIGMDIILWNVDGEDWNSKKTVKEIVEIQKKQTKNGSIILMHTQPDKYTSYEALKVLIPYYREQNYEFVRLDELLRVNAYKK
ncbi:polysaccharide deacetylase family protein [Cetobacterium sp. ZOR0034]|uniref:polysaccharide deacetylase family protein n=1 Tax=Cetobacterium sp. ZOR0034 TaxID=1339239 RepID=UPI00068B51B9|nr:polysaccharide deacetylase family protein [Cetobacterium sp. ZOR0034]